MKAQDDGKLVDHLYHEKSIFSSDEMIFVGDSKYYRDDIDVAGKSIGKQYTYAKNVIQVNMSHYIGHNQWLSIGGKTLRYRDAITEGYDFTPNFFIRSSIDFNKDLDLKRLELMHDPNHFEFEGVKQFHNRFFDRDTLFIQTIEVNFLYVLQYYARGRQNEKVSREFKDVIRKSIVNSLRSRYTFYLITITDPSYNRLSISKKNSYIHTHFEECRGRLFCPNVNSNSNVIILALEKNHHENDTILAAIDGKNSISYKQEAELSADSGIIPSTGSSH